MPILKTKKEEHKMTSTFLIKTLVKCFGETRTIKMLNQVNKRSINKKAKKYKASLQLNN
jgi:hypothetical protein